MRKLIVCSYRTGVWCGVSLQCLALELATVLFMTVLLPCQANLRFTSDSYEKTVSEATAVGTAILNLTAIPGTPGNALEYQLYGLQASPFQIDSITGSISIISTLDYEEQTSYMFNAQAIEAGIDSVMTTITIHLSNEDDNPLTCARTLLIFSMVEGPPEPSTIPLNCIDRDETAPDSISYQIVSSDAGSFAVDTTGSVTITSALDYEEQTRYDVEVNVTNSGVFFPPSNVLITILVIVGPKNEHSPVFVGSDQFTFSISESTAVGTTIATLGATDADEGVDGILIYFLEPGLTQSRFLVVPSSGDIVLANSLDYEEAILHQFTISVSDSSTDETERLSTTATVTIHVDDYNEYAPSFLKNTYLVVVSEMQPPGSTIAAIQCTDLDSNSELSYSVAPGTGSNHLSVDTSTGIITTTSMVEYRATGPNLFQLLAQCEDSGLPSHLAQAYLLVEIEPHNAIIRHPSLPSSEYLLTLSEDTPPGTAIVTIAAFDSNRGLLGPLHFSLVHSAQCSENLFYIDPINGTVYTIGYLNYETFFEHLCVASIFNTDSPEDYTANVDVIINVADINDEAPQCNPSLYILSIPEDSAIGSELLTLFCTDADTSDLQYTLTTSSTYFQIQSSGLDTILSLQNTIDSDVLSTFILQISVSDGQFSTTISVLVYVDSTNEYTPQFSASVYDCTVPENADIGTSVCSAVAADSDANLDGVVRYSIVSGNEYNTFGMDEETGSIVLAGHIDYEGTNGYMIIVSASDMGDLVLSSTVHVRIRVTDSNDNAPVISSLITVSVAEESVIGTIVAMLECSDDDSGSNGEVAYLLRHAASIRSDGEERTVAGMFSINHSTHALLLSSIPDAEEDTLFRLDVACMDNGSPSLSSYSTILVSITAVNEFIPQFSLETYSVVIAENLSPGTSVLSVSAVDRDVGSDGRLQYSVTPTEVGIAFLQISSTTGIVSTAQQIDCKWGTEHDFIITATDGGQLAYSSAVELHVELDNCRLGELHPQQAVYYTSVLENTRSGSVVVNVSCGSTRTYGESVAPEYSISSMSLIFQVDHSTGAVTILTPPDYEEAQNHTLQMICRDPNDRTSYAHFYIYITILPENEHSPQFLSPSYEAEILENTLPGMSLLRVEARDEDSSSHGDIEYCIQEEDQLFAVDSHTGIVYLLEYLDREEESIIMIHVIAYDHSVSGDRVHSSLTQVRIRILDVNDNSPKCNQLIYHVLVSPLLEVGQTLVDIECSDSDIGSNAELSYTSSTESTNTQQLFMVGADTGELILQQKIYWTDPIHYLTITVKDHGSPPLSTTVFIVLDIQGSLTAATGGDAVGEGLKNTITLSLKDISTDLWNRGAHISFKTAVARSVTQYCALLPNTCSLESGCTGFNRNKRSVTEELYTTFYDFNVVLLNSPIEFTSQASGYIYLNITFYVSLPGEASRTAFRTTDYVIPGDTLVAIIEEDEPIISAQVRDSVASPLTVSQPDRENTAWMWAAVVLSILLGSEVFVLIIIVSVKALLNWKKRSAKRKIGPVFELNDSSQEDFGVARRKTSHPEERNANCRKGTSIRLLVHRNNQQSAKPTFRMDALHSARTNEQSDDISTILLDTDVDVSMQGHSRSSPSAVEDFSEYESSLSSSQNSESRKGSHTSSDYMQNFPYEPPRAKVGLTALRIGHAKVNKVAQ